MFGTCLDYVSVLLLLTEVGLYASLEETGAMGTIIFSRLCGLSRELSNVRVSNLLDLYWFQKRE
jgi:hypothetical protein